MEAREDDRQSSLAPRAEPDDSHLDPVMTEAPLPSDDGELKSSSVGDAKDGRSVRALPESRDAVASVRPKVGATPMQRSWQPNYISRKDSPNENIDTGFTFGQNRQTRFTPIGGAWMRDHSAKKALSPKSTIESTNNQIASGTVSAATNMLEPQRPEKTPKSVAFVSEKGSDGLPERHSQIPSNQALRDSIKDQISTFFSAPEPHIEDSPNLRESSKGQDTQATTSVGNMAKDLASAASLPSHNRMPELSQSIREEHNQRAFQRAGSSTEVNAVEGNMSDGKMLSKENLLALILFRMQQEEKTHASERALMDARSLEAAELRDAHERLLAQYNELREHEQARTSEVSKQQQSLQTLQEKFKRVWDYMAGLTNDHNNLRAKAVQLVRSAEEAHQNKAAFRESLKEVTQSLQKSKTSRQAILNTAKTMVKTLDNKIQEQNGQIESQDEVLRLERERNEQLRAELSKLTEVQGESLASLATNTTALGEKFKDLPSTDAIKDLVESACNQDALKAMMEKSAAQLQALTDRETLSTDSLRFLQEFVQGHDTRMNEVIKQALQTLPDHSASQAQTLNAVQGLQTLLESVPASIQIERQRSAELAKVSAQRDQVEYELATKGTILTNAERKIAELVAGEKLALKEREQLKEELAILRSKPYIDPEAPVLLRESQRQNSDLHSQVARLQDDVLAKASAIQLHENHSQALQRDLGQLKDELRRSKENAASLEQRTANSEAEADRQIEKMRLSFLDGLEKEKAAINSEHIGVIHEVNAEMEKLASQIKERTAGLTALQESLASAKREIHGLQESQERQANSGRAQIGQLKHDVDSLKTTEAQLNKQIEDNKVTAAQLLDRLNNTIRSNGGTSVEDLDAAVDCLLARLDRLTNSEKSSTTNDSFHTAKSQMTPNTAVARTVSRGSDDNEAVADAIDFLETISPSTQAMGPWDTQETLVAGRSQELPYEGGPRRLQPALGSNLAIKHSTSSVTKSRSFKPQPDAKTIVREIQHSNDQGNPMTPDVAGESRAGQRKTGLEHFTSHMGLGRLRKNDRRNANNSPHIPRTPPPQGTSVPNGQQHSNSSARRHTVAESFREYYPTQSREVIAEASQAPGRAAAQSSSATAKQQVSSHARNIASDSAASAGIHFETSAVVANKFANAVDKEPKSILKKRKADDLSQESDTVPSRRRQGKGPTEGLGPMIEGPKTPKGSDKTRIGPRVRKSKRLGAQGRPDKFSRAYAAELDHVGGTK